MSLYLYFGLGRFLITLEAREIDHLCCSFEIRKGYIIVEICKTCLGKLAFYRRFSNLDMAGLHESRMVDPRR